jgi:tetratricopeptide (TPR) repeat protein
MKRAAAERRTPAIAGEDPVESLRLNLKVILLLVIGFCTIVIVATRVRSRLALITIRSITRGPLRPLTPPLTVDKAGIIAVLRAREFARLDTMFTTLQSAAEKDVRQEANLELALEAFKREDQSIYPLLDEWVKRSPSSYAASLARAESRSIRWSKSDYAAVRRDSIAALALNSKIAEAYALLIPLHRDDQYTCESKQQVDKGLKQSPASFIIRTAEMTCLAEEGGWSDKELAHIAREAQVHVDENPRLRALLGFVDGRRGEVAVEQQRNLAAIAYYTRSIDEGGDDATFYRGRGEALLNLGRNDEALDDLRRADQLWPQSPDTLQWLAYGLSHDSKNEEALRALDRDNEIEGPSSYNQELRISIIGSMTEKLPRAIGDAGN